MRAQHLFFELVAALEPLELDIIQAHMYVVMSTDTVCTLKEESCCWRDSGHASRHVRSATCAGLYSVIISRQSPDATEKKRTTRPAKYCRLGHVDDSGLGERGRDPHRTQAVYAPLSHEAEKDVPAPLANQF